VSFVIKPVHMKMLYRILKYRSKEIRYDKSEELEFSVIVTAVFLVSFHKSLSLIFDFS